jgi:hypothetical protein|tara:strand:+ start:567 stop:785 length:219 start_codon:yes stop_codon:yes gene_type:complete
MKESKLIEMQNTIDALKRVMQQTMNELAHLRELGIGTLELVKLMDSYDEALEKLQTKVTTKPEDKKLELDVE